MERPQVLVVSETIPPKYTGAGTSALLIANHFNNNGKLFKLITKTHKHPLENNRVLGEDKIRRVSFLNRKGQYNKLNIVFKSVISLVLFPYYFFFSFSFLLLNRKKINVVFLVSYSWLSFFIALFSMLFQKPYILETTLVGQDDPFGYASKRYSIAKSFMKKILFNNARIITNISPKLAQKCEEYGLPKSKIKVIPRTIDESKFKLPEKENELKLKNELLGGIQFFPVLLYSGVLNERKGIDIVYETYLQLKPHFPNILLVLAGNTHNNSTVDKVNREIQFRQKSKNILKLGHIQNVYDYMKIADIMFLPSRREGFGRVFVEAMACGLPVVCKRIEGVTDYIFNSSNAVVVNSESPLSFSNEIIKLLTNRDNKISIRREALKTYKTKFSNKIVFGMYDKLIEEALN